MGAEQTCLRVKRNMGVWSEPEADREADPRDGLQDKKSYHCPLIIKWMMGGGVGSSAIFV